MDWAKTTAREDKKHLSFGIWCDLYKRFYGRGHMTLCHGDASLLCEGNPSQRTNDAELWWFYWCTSVQSVKQTLELLVMWGTMTLMWSPCIFDTYRAVTATTPVEYQCLSQTSLQILGSHWLMLFNDNRYEKDRPSPVQSIQECDLSSLASFIEQILIMWH